MDGFRFPHLATDTWNFYEFTNFKPLKKELFVSHSRITSSMLRQKISLDHLRKTAQITSYKEKHHIPFTFMRSNESTQPNLRSKFHELEIVHLFKTEDRLLNTKQSCS